MEENNKEDFNIQVKQKGTDNGITNLAFSTKV